MAKQQSEESKTKRTRKPLNKYTAAERIAGILADIPEAERDSVLTFVRGGRQLGIAELFRVPMTSALSSVSIKESETARSTDDVA